MSLAKSFPQKIAHRGSKTEAPENTIAAFELACTQGCQAFETDVQLTKDNVVVIHHDPSLLRVYGRDAVIKESNFRGDLDQLHNINDASQKMITFQDLLDLLEQPRFDSMWVMIDIKPYASIEVVKAMADILNNRKTKSLEWWANKLVFGFSLAKFLHLLQEYLPTFKLVYIGFSVASAIKFLSIPQVSGANVFVYSLVSASGDKLLEKARKMKKQVFAWTVNDYDMMKWCISKGLSGVLSDNPEKFKRALADPESSHFTLRDFTWNSYFNTEYYSWKAYLMADLYRYYAFGVWE